MPSQRGRKMHEKWVVADIELDCQPVCPRCEEAMVFTNYQNEEGDWFACWLCGCAPTVGPSLGEEE